MALDPNISLGVRPIQLEMPNQLAQYAQISQIQNAQQANQLNQMQMAEYQRARAEEEGTRNFLSGANLTDPNVRSELLTKYGKSGREIYGKLSEAEKAQTEYIMFLHSDFYVSKNWDKVCLDIFEKYPNEWYILGKSLGKCCIVNAHYSSININSISEWKLLPINKEGDII